MTEDDGLEFKACSEVEFFGEKTLEAGIIVGHPADTMYLRFNFPNIDDTLQIILDETEALALIHLLSGVMLTMLADQVEEDGDSDARPGRASDGHAELGQGHLEGSTTTDD